MSLSKDLCTCPMRTERYRSILEEILNEAGVGIDGSHSWDLHVHDERFFRRVILEGALGAGESYMDGWWDAAKLDELFFKLLRSNIEKALPDRWRDKVALLAAAVINRQRRAKADEVGKRHYDLGNALFQAMLDERMVYSCAYWKDAATLEEAQERKLDLICRKLGLQAGMTMLDIGCGWGSLAKFAAERYGVSVLGINNSKEQTALGQSMCSCFPVEIRMQDYRDVSGRFDRIASVGMFEHVGPKNYRSFMQKVSECLEDDGLFLLHTLGAAERRRGYDGFTQKYIFPRGVIPTQDEIGPSIEGIFCIEDLHNIGAHYDPTLLAWYERFEKNWDRLSADYDDRFRRMWTYFLLSFAGSSRARRIHVWQIVLSKNGMLGGYESIR